MEIDLKRRKSVMGRSMRLGHCVCDPKQPCPCDMFKRLGICQCAGERPPRRTEPEALTRTVRKAGCASKIGQADLLRIVESLPPVQDANVLLGGPAGDDAGVYRLDERAALVQTVDVFAPCVDDPFLFGQIAAANSLSDVYAMGGRPLTALSIVGYPIDRFDSAMLERMLRGGALKLQEAGCALLGGHSVNDEEIKFGFAVTGLIDPARIVARDTPQPGDRLVLTKPLGTGMIAFAAQIGRASPQCLRATGEAMAALNRDAAELMIELGAHACTDITGFGLAGHLAEMARRGRVRIRLDLESLPVYAAAVECLEQEIVPGAVESNQQYAMGWIDLAPEVEERWTPILYDPQTSGGLLIALPEARAEEFVQRLRARGGFAAAIGAVERRTEGEGRIAVRGTRLAAIVGEKGIAMAKPENEGAEMLSAMAAAFSSKASAPLAGSPPADACCASPPGAGPESADGLNAEALFGDFMRHVGADGALDKRTKRLMTIALSTAQRCAPCLRIHWRGALADGIDQQAIEEAVWLGVAFGGAPAMMLAKEMREEIRQTI